MKKVIPLLLITVLGFIVCQPTVEVPDLKNSTVENAKIALKSKGLLIEVVGVVESAEVAEGLIAEQSPMAGSVVKKGATVKVWLSKGVPERIVPYLVGLSLSDATHKLDALNLKVGKIENQYSDEIPENHIIATEPPSGTKVPKGTAVNLVVSLGPKPVETVVVPKVTGYKHWKAEDILKSKGLKVKKIYRVSTEYYEGTVYAQKPKAGEIVPKGTVVTLYVATVLR